MTKREDQLKVKNEDIQDAQDFQKLRPEFKTINMEDIKEDMESLDDMAIKQETIDFSYVPVAQWTTDNNSLYERGVIQDKIRYGGKFLNECGVGYVNRVGTDTPLKVDWKPKKTPKPYIEDIQPRMVIDGALGRNMPFINTSFKLNYDTKPIATDDSNLFMSNWLKSNYVPDSDQMAWADPNPSKVQTKKEVSTAPTMESNQLTAVGMGFYNFDNND